MSPSIAIDQRARADALDPGAHVAQVADEVPADELEEPVHELTRLVRGRRGERLQQGHVDGGRKLRNGAPGHPEPLGGPLGTARVEVLGRLQPVAELERVVVEPERVEDEAQRARRRVVARELVVVEVRARRLVRAAHVDHGDRRIGEVLGGGLAPLDGTAVESDQHAHREQVVLVRAARVGDDESDGVHGGGGS